MPFIASDYCTSTYTVRSKHPKRYLLPISSSSPLVPTGYNTALADLVPLYGTVQYVWKREGTKVASSILLLLLLLLLPRLNYSQKSLTRGGRGYFHPSILNPSSSVGRRGRRTLSIIPPSLSLPTKSLDGYSDTLIFCSQKSSRGGGGTLLESS